MTRFQTAGWDGQQALTTLGIAELDTMPDDMTPASRPDSKPMGCSRPEGVWIHADTKNPIRVLAHELGHTLLGHHALIGTMVTRGEWQTMEIEAESVAKLVLAHVGMDTAESDLYMISLGVLGFITAMIGSCPTDVQKKVQAAADKILAAGKIQEEVAA